MTCTATDMHGHDSRLRSLSGGHLSLRSVNHISKVCSRLEASVAFYRDVLGFMVVKRPQSFEDSFEGCWMWRYGLGLHLIKGQPVPRPGRIDPKADHLSFQADSLEDVEAQLLRLRVPFVRQAVVEDGITVQQLFFHDPDNNMIEICNCDCLPIIPIDLARCSTCAAEAATMAPPSPHVKLASLPPAPHEQGYGLACCQLAQHARLEAQQELSEDEAMSDSRGSMDSSRSEQYGTTPRAYAALASAFAAAPGPSGDA